MITSRYLYALAAIFAFAHFALGAEPAAKRPLLDDVLQQPAKLEFQDASLVRVAQWLAAEYQISNSLAV